MAPRRKKRRNLSIETIYCNPSSTNIDPTPSKIPRPRVTSRDVTSARSSAKVTLPKPKPNPPAQASTGSGPTRPTPTDKGVSATAGTSTTPATKSFMIIQQPGKEPEKPKRGRPRKSETNDKGPTKSKILVRKAKKAPKKAGKSLHIYVSRTAGSCSYADYEEGSASEGGEPDTKDQPLVARQRRTPRHVFTTAQGRDIAAVCEINAIPKLKNLAIEATIVEDKKQIAELELERAKYEDAKMEKMESRRNLVNDEKARLEEMNESGRLKLRNNELETEMARVTLNRERFEAVDDDYMNDGKSFTITVM